MSDEENGRGSGSAQRNVLDPYTIGRCAEWAYLHGDKTTATNMQHAMTVKRLGALCRLGHVGCVDPHADPCIACTVNAASDNTHAGPHTCVPRTSAAPRDPVASPDYTRGYRDGFGAGQVFDAGQHEEATHNKGEAVPGPREQALRHAMVAVALKAEEDGNVTIRQMVAEALWGDTPAPCARKESRGVETGVAQLDSNVGGEGRPVATGNVSSSRSASAGGDGSAAVPVSVEHRWPNPVDAGSSPAPSLHSTTSGHKASVTTAELGLMLAECRRATISVAANRVSNASSVQEAFEAVEAMATDSVSEADK